jgi:hypothetical protein
MQYVRSSRVVLLTAIILCTLLSACTFKVIPKSQAADSQNQDLDLLKDAKWLSDEAYNLKIKHILATTDCLIAIHEACELSGFSLSWETEREIQSQLTKETKRFIGPDGQEYRTPIPDLLITLKREEKRALCWVEVDRATETIALSTFEKQSVEAKAREYLAWEESALYRQDPELTTRPLRTLFLTVGSLRMHNMVAAAEKVIRQRLAQQTNLSDDEKQAEFVRLSKRFRFLTFDSMQPETLLTGPVWTVPGRDTLQTMFE